MTELAITTSWDDGDVHAARLADLLDRFGLLGTFYVSGVSPEAERLDEAGIRSLARRHEVGAHTVRHVRLDWITTAQAREEIFGSRDWLSDVTGAAPTSFCYPWGKWTPRVVELVREAGFAYARTIEHLEFSPSADRLLCGTTSQTIPQAYYLPRLVGSANWRLVRSLAHTESFLLECARTCARRGRPFHLWGHAWEVERFDQWTLLEDLFARLAQEFRLVPVTNAQLP